MAIDVNAQKAVSTVRKTLRKVSGNLPGLAGIISGRGGDSSDFAGLNRRAKSPNLYAFPIDVTAAPGLGNHGHYMIFYINQQQNARLKFGQPESGQSNMDKEQATRNIPAYIKEMLPNGAGTDTKKSNELQKQVQYISHNMKVLTQYINMSSDFKSRKSLDKLTILNTIFLPLGLICSW